MNLANGFSWEPAVSYAGREQVLEDKAVGAPSFSVAERNCTSINRAYRACMRTCCSELHPGGVYALGGPVQFLWGFSQSDGSNADTLNPRFPWPVSVHFRAVS